MKRQGAIVMQPDSISLLDWQRILIGDTTWLFLVELPVRVILVYFMLLVVMRLMGKRMAAQLSISELAVMLTLGAAIGLPIQAADKGLLAAAVLLLTALIFQRGLSRLAFERRSVEVASQGDVTLLLKDGRLLLEKMRSSQLTLRRVQSELRIRDVQHLGELRRVYLESSGHFSLVWYREPKWGLSLIPTEQGDYGKQALVDGYFACSRCGALRESKEQPEEECDFCGNRLWQRAIKRLGLGGTAREEGAVP
jgi:uncharacterized membrane protein YcaP (DUF421 family)